VIILPQEIDSKLAKYFAASRNKNAVWRRADVRFKGCVKAGRFGALGAYKFSIRSVDVLDFKAK